MYLLILRELHNGYLYKVLVLYYEKDITKKGKIQTLNGSPTTDSFIFYETPKRRIKICID